MAIKRIAFAKPKVGQFRGVISGVHPLNDHRGYGTEIVIQGNQGGVNCQISKKVSEDIRPDSSFGKLLGDLGINVIPTADFDEDSLLALDVECVIAETDNGGRYVAKITQLEGGGE